VTIVKEWMKCLNEHLKEFTSLDYHKNFYMNNLNIQKNDI
ncbi:16908_t:CDS:1, partial [Acaulospora colombiana]